MGRGCHAGLPACLPAKVLLGKGSLGHWQCPAASRAASVPRALAKQTQTWVWEEPPREARHLLPPPPHPIHKPLQCHSGCPRPLPAAEAHWSLALQAGTQCTTVLGTSLCAGPRPQVQVAEQDPPGAQPLWHGLQRFQGCSRAHHWGQVSPGSCYTGSLLCYPAPQALATVGLCVSGCDGSQGMAW